MKKGFRILSCIALFVPMVASAAERTFAGDGKHLFILSGQSNMRQPLPDSFKEAVSEVFGKDKVLVATVSRPSQPIKKWYKKWTPPEGMEADRDEVYGELYDSLLKAVERAIGGKELSSVTYIWMQGEADAGSGWGAVYEKSFLGILDQLKEDLGISEIHFVIGRINDRWLPDNGTKDGDVVRGVQEKLGEENANGDWVNTDDLNTGINPWGLYEINGGHFPPAGYEVLGQRFARKACLLLDPELELDEGVFDAVFFGSGEDIKSHQGIAKKITGTVPESGAADLAALVDGKFGSDDPKGAAWIGFPSSLEVIEFVVDLGEEKEISGFGMNILLNEREKALFPKKVTLLMSMDGQNYKPAHNKGIGFFYKPAQRAKWLEELKSEPVLLLLTPNKTSARYVKIQIESENSAKLFVDEIIVNPSAE